MRKPSTGGNAPHRDDANDPTVLRSLCGVPGLSRTVAAPHDGKARARSADLYADGYSPLGCRWRSDPVNLCRRRLGARDRRFARLYGLLISRSTRRAAIVALPSVLAERPAYAAVGIIAPWDSGGLRGHLDAAVWVEMSGRIEAASGLPMDGPPPNDHYPKAPGDGCSARVAVSRFACRRTAQSRPTTSGGATTSRRRLCPSGEAALVASS